MIKFIFNLINYFEKSNKHGRIWTYGIYLWQNNIRHEVWKFEYIFQKLGLWMVFLGEFFLIMYDIDIHQLNLRKI